MKEHLENKSLTERFRHLFDLIGSVPFRKNRGPENEVPFYICPFNPGEAADMERAQGNLVKKLENRGILILEINLYDLSVKILRERGIWDQILKTEGSVPKDQLLELMQGVLDPETHLVPAIKKKCLKRPGFQVLFLTGVGEVFPFIRSHNVLNNLQRAVPDKPAVMFFPGAYTYSPEAGASLSLFGLFRGDRYYRAFNIYNCGV